MTSILRLALAVTAVGFACGSSPAQKMSCPQGGERCVCYGNSTCNAGLQCLSNLCVSPSGAAGSSGAAGQPGTGGSGGAVSSGGTIGAGGGGAGGSVGAGGAVGSGGNAGSGGSTGSGGAAASGGSVGSGGSGGSGGSTGAGGKAGMGGAGGSAGAAGGAGAVGSGGAGGTGACGDLLDDMEAGTGHICQGNGRVGYWYTYIDSNLGSSITPPASENPTLPQMPTLSRVATSTRAMHASGSYSSFAGIGFLVNAPVINDPWSTFDASGYSGIVFWAMGTGTARVLLQIPATVATQYNGTCVTSACMGAVSHSYQLSANSWNEIAVPFSALTSGNTTFLPSVLAAIEFQPTTPGTFDLWIDDVRFY